MCCLLSVEEREGRGTHQPIPAPWVAASLEPSPRLSPFVLRCKPLLPNFYLTGDPPLQSNSDMPSFYLLTMTLGACNQTQGSCL